MNRCDHPGCHSRVTQTYLVGLGGIPAFYCVDHAPVAVVSVRDPKTPFEQLVNGEITTEEYVADIKRRVEIAMETREAMRKHRRRKPIAFPWRRRPEQILETDDDFEI